MNKDIYKINNIRAFAILIVIIGHSIILYSNSWNLYSTNYQVPIMDMLKSMINVFQMPLFFSLSGFLFYNTLRKKEKLIKFIIKKIKRLIIPFFSIAILWMIPIKYFVNYNNYNNQSIIITLKNVFNLSDSGHLWYLPTLFFIFLIYFILYKTLSKIIKNNNMIYLVLFIVTVMMQILCKKIVLVTSIYNVLNYSFYFFVGMIINMFNIYKCDIKRKNKVILSLLLIVFIISSIKITNYFYILFATTMILLLIYLIAPNKENDCLNKISDNSFGMYLFHSPLIYITYSYLNNFNPFYVVYINFIIFGTTSYLLTKCIKKTKFKFIIGS